MFVWMLFQWTAYLAVYFPTLLSSLNMFSRSFGSSFFWHDGLPLSPSFSFLLASFFTRGQFSQLVKVASQCRFTVGKGRRMELRARARLFRTLYAHAQSEIEHITNVTTRLQAKAVTGAKTCRLIIPRSEDKGIH